MSGEKRRLAPPAPELVAKQDPRYTRSDFLRDLEVASRRLRDVPADAPVDPRGGRRPSPSRVRE